MKKITTMQRAIAIIFVASLNLAMSAQTDSTQTSNLDAKSIIKSMRENSQKKNAVFQKMKQMLIFLFLMLMTSVVKAGPHTVQRGETFADIAKLYGVTVDTLQKVNNDKEAHVGMLIDVPNNALVYDVSSNTLLRKLFHSKASSKAHKLYDKAHKRQMKLKHLGYSKRIKEEYKIAALYERALLEGSIKALYQLGRYYLHGRMYADDSYPDFSKSITSDIDKLTKGIEYLQIAAIVDRNRKASVELAMACIYKSSPIYNPLLGITLLECYYEEYSLPIGDLICQMYENGEGIKRDYLKAYIYCPSADMVMNSSSSTTHKERILKKIESLPIDFESSKYGVGIDSTFYASFAMMHFRNDKLDPEGFFWLHRAARKNDADACWLLAGIIQSEKYDKSRIRFSSAENQYVKFARMASELGHEEATDFIDKYDEYQRKLEKYEAERRRAEYEAEQAKKRSWAQMWVNFIGQAVNIGAQAYVMSQASKQQSQMSTPGISMPVGSMSDAQFAARNNLALQQIGQYTHNKVMADWYGVPMMPTDMSAVNLGTDMSPGSPLWCWNQQQQINTMATQKARMEWENVAFLKRQAQQIEQQIIANPTAPIAGYFDREGNWISAEMVAAGGGDGGDTTNTTKKSTTDLRQKNINYWEERYGDKDCHSCHRTGVCSTCNGKGYAANSMTSGYHECPNCYKINGKSSGRCGLCQGKGTIFGLK